MRTWTWQWLRYTPSHQADELLVQRDGVTTALLDNLTDGIYDDDEQKWEATAQFIVDACNAAEQKEVPA